MAFNLKKVLKALLFSSSQPLSIKEIQEAFTRFHEPGTAGSALAAGGQSPAAEAGTAPLLEAGAAPEEPAVESPAEAELYAEVPALVTSAQIREAMDEIAAELRGTDDVYLLTEGAQGFRLVTHPRLARWVRVLRDEPPPVKLSPTAMETLAVIAYRQPVTRAEIEHIRGVSADAGLAKLLERELIYIVGRAELPGRPIQYGTTEAFLEFVGARSLEELPATDVLSRQQINDWLQNAMRTTHPSDRDMGLAEEGEEQLSLDDAARGAAAPEATAAGPAPEPAATPAGGETTASPAGPTGPA
jgi:segregation and condensation protein B